MNQMQLSASDGDPRSHELIKATYACLAGSP